MIVAAIWAGVQIWAGALEAEQIKQQQKLKERLAEQNALFAEQDAFNAEASGFTDSARYQTTINATIGAQRAGYAAQNVDVNFGTAKEIQNESRLTGVLNQMDMQRRGHERARGFQREASDIRFGTQMGRIQSTAEASNAFSQGLMSGVNTLASGYSKFSSVKGTTNPSSTGGLTNLSKEYRAGNLKADSDFWSRNPYK